MNIINNGILIIILLLLANYLSNGSIITVIIKYYNLLIAFIFSKTEEFSNIINEKSKNFLFSSSNNEECTFDNNECNFEKEIGDYLPDLDNIYNYKDLSESKEKDLSKIKNFLEKLLGSNKNFYELTPSNSKEINLSQIESDIIRKYLIKSLKSNDYKFNNIDIIDKLIYYSNPRGKEMKPFRFTTDVYSKNDIPIGHLTVYVEMFFKNDELFQGLPTITRIKINHNDKIESPVAADDLEDSDNNLIPDSVHFSTDIKSNSPENYDYENVRNSSYIIKKPTESPLKNKKVKNYDYQEVNNTESSIEIPNIETSEEVVNTEIETTSEIETTEDN
jgi:hypothetical protein